MKAPRVLSAGRAVDRLIDELLASTDRIANDSRFHSLKIALRLSKRCAAAQPERPEESKRLGTAALEVLDHLPSIERIATSVGPRANCLIGNACRLTGDLDQAESAYSAAASWICAQVADTPAFLRGYALLRWEQGRYDEAVGLLIRAERLYRDAGLGLEAQATVQLLLLLHAEMGELEDAIALFHRLGPVDPSVRPWLSARAGLTAAFCIASLSDLDRPEQALAALAHGSSLIPFVRDPNELLQLDWLEARARARMGHDEGGTLIALRDRFAKSAVTLDYLLITLDLIAARMTEHHDLHELLEGLKSLTASIPKMVVATEAILFSLELHKAGGADLWKSASSTSLLLRRFFRSSRLPVTPLPFA